MKIELLHIDDCPSWRNGLRNLQTALREEGLAESIQLIRVIDDADANRRKFLGSPSYRVDDTELWPEERESYSLSCRIYRTPQGMKGFPTVAMLREALQQ